MERDGKDKSIALEHNRDSAPVKYVLFVNNGSQIAYFTNHPKNATKKSGSTNY